MKTSPWKSVRALARGCLVLLGASALCACSVLSPAAKAAPSFYALEYVQTPAPTPPRTGVPPPLATATLIISPVRSASGFDSQRIIYTREPHKLEYFAHNEWVDTPARMLAPLLAAAIGRTGKYRAVVLTPSSASGDVRLDTEIVRLQQEFQTSPSRVHFTLVAQLLDEKTRRVLAVREFDGHALAAHDDPVAGVAAANRVVRDVLDELALFLLSGAY